MFLQHLLGILLAHGCYIGWVVCDAFVMRVWYSRDRVWPDWPEFENVSDPLGFRTVSHATHTQLTLFFHIPERRILL